MPILSLMAKIGLDGRGFKAGLKEAEGQARNFGAGLRSQLAAAFSVAAVAGFLKNIADTVGRIKDLADQSRVTTDEMQKIDVALKKNGLTFENFQQVLQKVAAARRKAIEDDEGEREIFRKTGVSVGMLRDERVRDVDIVLRQIGVIRELNLTSEEQLEITDLWGTKANKLITALQDLEKFDNIELFTSDDIKVIDDANKGLEEMIRKLKILAAHGLVEATRRPIDFIKSYLEGIDSWLPGASGAGIMAKLLDMAFPTPGSSAPALTQLDVVKGNIDKSNRTAADRAAAENEMYELDKKEKEKRKRAIAGASLDFGKSGGLAPAGFGAVGGFSAGFISGFDPKTFIEQSQLVELQKINDKLEAIKNKSYGGADGAFTP